MGLERPLINGLVPEIRTDWGLLPAAEESIVATTLFLFEYLARRLFAQELLGV